MEKLKPCPFCGSSEILLSDPRQVDAITWASDIECDSCGVSVGVSWCSDSANQAIVDVVDVWNNRV